MVEKLKYDAVGAARLIGKMRGINNDIDKMLEGGYLISLVSSPPGADVHLPFNKLARKLITLNDQLRELVYYGVLPGQLEINVAKPNLFGEEVQNAETDLNKLKREEVLRRKGLTERKKK